MPEPVAKRLNDYIKEQALQSNDRLFPICYSTARYLIRRLGSNLHVRLTPHDLRRYSATYASRNGVPLEIVSKVILRHQDLKTTQSYLGKVSDSEAIRWMDILHGKQNCGLSLGTLRFLGVNPAVSRIIRVGYIAAYTILLPVMLLH